MVKKISRSFLLALLVFFLSLNAGCLTARGVLYLEKEQIETYLAKEKRPTGGGEKEKMLEQSVEKARALLREVPDGNRIMGGFCTQKYVTDKFQELVDASPTCRKKIKVYQNQSNTYGIVFWSLLGATAGTGLAMGISIAALPPTSANGAARVGLGLGFGIPMVLLAIANTSVPFSEWQDEARVKMQRIDNYMWTLRKRVQIEVCNAGSEDVAFDRMDEISRDFKLLCNAPETDDGVYRIPTK
jgi:hypothetical protein